MNKNLIRLIKTLAFFGVIYFIYLMVKNRDSIFILKNILINLSVGSYSTIIFVFFLQFVNWSLEAIKFKEILKKKNPITLKDSIKAIYIGNASSIFTPDRLGNFIGRAFYLRKNNKIVITSASMLGNLAQLLSTLTFATIAMLLIVSTNNSITIIYENPKAILALIIVINLIVASLFFHPLLFILLVLKIKWLKKYRSHFLFIAKYSIVDLLLFYSLSLIRYIIFIVQFYLLLIVFGLQLEAIELLIFIGLMYFVTTFIPSPFLGNLGTREISAMYLLSSFNQPESILAASLSIWLINVIFPALLGFILAFNMNLYKKAL